MLTRRTVSAVAAVALLAGCSGATQESEAPASAPPVATVVCAESDTTAVAEAVADLADSLPVVLADTGCDLTVGPVTAAGFTVTGPEGTTDVAVVVGEAMELAGYLAAATTRTGTMASWGAAVEAEGDAVDGSLRRVDAGVQRFNVEVGADVEHVAAPVTLLPGPADEAVEAGSDAEALAAAAEGARAVADGLLADGADVTVVAAGPLSHVMLRAITDAGSGRVIWVSVGPGGAALPTDAAAETVLAVVSVDLVALLRPLVEAVRAGGALPAELTATLGIGVEVVVADPAVSNEVLDAAAALRASLAEAAVG